MFPSSPEDGLYNYIFLIARLLAYWKRLALAPLFLGSFNMRLDEPNTVVQSVRRYDVVTYAYVNFLQLSLWERFGELSPMRVKFKVAKPRRS